MTTPPPSLPLKRLGFYYHPGTTQYRDDDLALWLPRLRALGASWLVLQAPSQRAIPEAFLRGLINEGIQPILQFHLSPGTVAPPADMALLLNIYVRWGVRYVVFFDRPNLRLTWPAADWSRPELVERFLDHYLPLANLALERHLSPVFPALEPGGDFWDTAFLHASLAGLARRSPAKLLDELVLGAYAWSYQHPLDWGSGGPARWPQAQPYSTDPDIQDQRGLRIFDWYQSIAQSVLGHTCPILLLAAGSRSASPQEQPQTILNQEIHREVNLELARLALGLPSLYPAMPAEVLACNLWLLSDAPESPTARQAWFRPDGSTLPVVEDVRQMVKSATAPSQPQAAPTPSEVERPAHYLLLPPDRTNLSTPHLLFVQKFQPLVGSSPEEAAKARRVTLAGDRSAFPEFLVTQLLNLGCLVDWIREDGTLIATKMVPPSSAA